MELSRLIDMKFHFIFFEIVIDKLFILYIIVYIQYILYSQLRKKRIFLIAMKEVKDEVKACE